MVKLSHSVIRQDKTFDFVAENVIAYLNKDMTINGILDGDTTVSGLDLGILIGCERVMPQTSTRTRTRSRSSSRGSRSRSSSRSSRGSRSRSSSRESRGSRASSGTRRTLAQGGGVCKRLEFQYAIIENLGNGRVRVINTIPGENYPDYFYNNATFTAYV
jgi:hypothetical protein